MSFSSRLGFTKLFCILCLVIAASCSQNSVEQDAKAQRGVLDIRHWDFTSSPTISLSGEWEFHWKKLYDNSDFNGAITEPPAFVPVPSVWNEYTSDTISLPNTGYATYRLRILHGKPYEHFALRIKTLGTSAKILVADKIVSIGKVGDSAEESRPAYSPQVIEFQSTSGETEIILQIANFSYRKGGPWRKISFGLPESLIEKRQKGLFLDFFLAGSFLIIGLYHLCYFLLRQKAYSALFFGIFCLLMALRVINTGEYAINFIADINWAWKVKWEFLSYYAGLGIFYAFFWSMFSSVIDKRLFFSVEAIVTFFCLLVVFTDPLFFSRTLISFHVFNILLVIVSGRDFVNAIRQHQEGAVIFAVGFAIFFATILHDILYANEFVDTGYLFSYGIFIFIFFQAFILLRRFSRSLEESTRLGVKLKNLNQQLEKKVADRTKSLKEKNRELRENNQEIERKNKELQKLNSELDQFVYSVSHDLKAPIASAMGLVNISKLESDVSKVRYYIKLQEDSLIKLNRFIDDILNYSRNSRLDLQRESIDFKGLLTNLFDQLLNPGDESIQKIIEVKQNDNFKSDRRRVMMVLGNVISNSLKYRRNHEVNPYVKVSINADDKAAVIRITDNGMGIDKEHLDNIFKMFYRANDVKKGSGLGLYIVKEAISKLGGDIQVDSVLGEGTVLTFSIPNLSGTSTV